MLDHVKSEEDFAAVFARYVAEARLEALPEAAIMAAKANLLDTLACSAAGRTAPGVTELAPLVLGWGGAPEAAVWWSKDRLPAPQAAWLNGVMAHARDYDDTHDAAILHAGVSVVPAALAAADMAGDPVSGADLLTAVVLGLEMVCRLGVATRIGLTESGFIYSSLYGYFGATAAAARVLGLTADQTVNALGIAFSQAAGTHQVTRDGALTKRMQPGFAARAALVSVAMTRAGIRGAQRVFEGADGLSRIYVQSQIDGAILRDGLGQRFHMADLSYKPYPCCRFNHTPIDAALALRAQPGFDFSRLGRLRLYTNRQAQEVVGLPLDMRRRPANVVQAQFSSPYTVACALLNGRVTLEDFTETALSRPDVLALAAKVEPLIAPDIEAASGRNISPARLEAEVADRMMTVTVEQPSGHPARPMGAQAIMAKVQDCLAFGGLSPSRATGLMQAIQGLDGQIDAARLLARNLHD
jgi:2-methylcitrate dehydratase PrpD